MPDISEKYSEENKQNGFPPGNLPVDNSTGNGGVKGGNTSDENDGAGHNDPKARIGFNINIYPKEKKKKGILKWWSWANFWLVASIVANIYLVYLTREALSDNRKKDAAQAIIDGLRIKREAERFSLDSSLIKAQIAYFKDERKNREFENRPRITIDSIGVDSDEPGFTDYITANYNKVGKTLGVPVVFSNVGNKPCQILEVYMRAEIDSSDKAITGLIPFRQNGIDGINLEPGWPVTFVANSNDTLSQGAVTDYAKGVKVMYIIVHVKFKDLITQKRYWFKAIQKTTPGNGFGYRSVLDITVPY